MQQVSLLDQRSSVVRHYGRAVGFCHPNGPETRAPRWVLHDGGQWTSVEMVLLGYAWWFREYAPNEKALEEAEGSAPIAQSSETNRSWAKSNFLGGDHSFPVASGLVDGGRLQGWWRALKTQSSKVQPPDRENRMSGGVGGRRFYPGPDPILNIDRENEDTSSRIRLRDSWSEIPGSCAFLPMTRETCFRGARSGHCLVFCFCPNGGLLGVKRAVTARLRFALHSLRRGSNRIAIGGGGGGSRTLSHVSTRC